MAPDLPDGRPLILLLLACGATEPAKAPPLPPPPPKPTAPEAERVTRLRDILRARLGEAYDQPVPGLEAASPVRGQRVYDAHCASCHGYGGQGDHLEGSTFWDFTAPAFREAYSEAGRVSVIRDGLPTTDMPGFAAELTEAQILDAYDFVRHLVDPADLE